MLKNDHDLMIVTICYDNDDVDDDDGDNDDK